MAWRLEVVSRETVAGPVRVSVCELIRDPARYVASTLADLEIAIAAANAGKLRSCLVDLVDEHIERLARCGVQVVIHGRSPDAPLRYPSRHTAQDGEV